ncbi:MAG TPA: hypothetical protein ENI87_10225, partial [bacterium]|nr:hypothetical protein [bacterium]
MGGSAAHRRHGQADARTVRRAVRPGRLAVDAGARAPGRTCARPRRPRSQGRAGPNGVTGHCREPHRCRNAVVCRHRSSPYAFAMSSPLPYRQLSRHLLDLLEDRTALRPRIAMLLGSGHASIANQLKDKVVIHGDDLPGDPLPSPILVGILEGTAVAVADAPLASYEGHSSAELAQPVRMLKALGCELLVLTAGAASLSQQIEAGGIAVVEDHLNLSGVHPLVGPNDDQIGPRFPDMSEPYSLRWSEIAREVAWKAGVPCVPGVFAAMAGPSMPTRAEYRFLRQAG